MQPKKRSRSQYCSFKTPLGPLEELEKHWPSYKITNFNAIQDGDFYRVVARSAKGWEPMKWRAFSQIYQGYDMEFNRQNKHHPVVPLPVGLLDSVDASSMLVVSADGMVNTEEVLKREYACDTDFKKVVTDALPMLVPQEDDWSVLEAIRKILMLREKMAKNEVAKASLNTSLKAVVKNLYLVIDPVSKYVPMLKDFNTRDNTMEQRLAMRVKLEKYTCSVLMGIYNEELDKMGDTTTPREEVEVVETAEGCWSNLVRKMDVNGKNRSNVKTPHWWLNSMKRISVWLLLHTSGCYYTRELPPTPSMPHARYSLGGLFAMISANKKIKY